MSGRDIGAGVLAILKKLKVTDFTPLPEVIGKIQQWERKQVTKLAVHGLADQQDRVRDQANVLYAFAEDCGTTREMFQKLDNLFSEVDGETKGQVMCSSVHKSKGLESSRVFVLSETFYRRGYTLEEANTVYVAVTRAIRHLTFVNPTDMVKP
jgi:superfamily I DNA/RNA helicase